MTYPLSPYDMTSNMSTYTASSHAAHRPSLTPNTQSGNPYRVGKPRSSHNSPRTVERRKTTTGAKLYATLDDHYNMMMGIDPDEDAFHFVPEPATSRPVSWHPTTARLDTRRQSSLFPSSHMAAREYSVPSRKCDQASDFYSLSSNNSMCAKASPYYSNCTFGYEAHRDSRDSNSSWQTQQSQATSSYSTPATEPIPWYLQEWARRNQDQAVVLQNDSAEFLPIQHPTGPEDEPEDVRMEESGKELVGMGLYDLPDTSLDWTSPAGEATGKGLKLEETWQPPEVEEEEEEQDDDDEDDGEDGEEGDEQEDDDASSDDGEEELPPPPPAPIASINPVKTNTSSNLEGQSFFFDDDDSVTKEWWYQHLKQPSIPVRDTGYGYGWL